MVPFPVSVFEITLIKAKMADTNNNDLEGRTTKTTLEHFYPEIHKLAKKYLSLRGSSVSSERVFSLCGQIVNKKRSKKH